MFLLRQCDDAVPRICFFEIELYLAHGRRARLEQRRSCNDNNGLACDFHEVGLCGVEEQVDEVGRQSLA